MYSSLVSGSTSMSAGRHSRGVPLALVPVSLLIAEACPASPICSRKVPSWENLSTCESGPWVAAQSADVPPSLPSPLAPLPAM